MKLIWTKSNMILSKAIRWILDTDCSHFAVVFESPAGGILFESNLLGTHPKFYRTAQKHFTVVHEIDIPMSLEEEDRVWNTIVDQYDGKKYDWGAFAYFMVCGIRKKLFKTPLPKRNLWASSNSFICDEIYKAAGSNVPDLKIDLAITDPHTVYDLIVANKKDI